MGIGVRMLRVLGVCALVACSGESTQPVAPECSSALTSQMAIGVTAYRVVDATQDSGCVSFPANASATDAEYLIVAQSGGATPGISVPYAVRSGGAAPVRVTARLGSQIRGAPEIGPRPARWAARVRQLGPVAAGFDRRQRDRERVATLHLTPARRAAIRQVRTAYPAPAFGSERQFHVCADYQCDRFSTVAARVQAVGTHVAIYVDEASPGSGMTAPQLDSLQQLFDTLYAVDTTAFGSISDADNNGVVLMLMTGVVNQTVTTAECNAGGYVAGFFMSSDLVPDTPLDSANSNHGEIFYTVVPDPNGTLSCPHTLDEIESVLPPTFLHELQHVIGFNQHVLIHNGPQEDVWLDEALSSFAEELGGRYFLPDTAAFTQYVIGDLYNAYLYLSNPPAHFLLQESDTVLADFGAGWLFIRYLADQYGPAIAGALEQTARIGTDNVAAQTRMPFDSTAARWALANWVSDLPGFTPPAVLRYTSWSLRSTFASLSAQDPFDFPSRFPLAPALGAAGQVSVSGTLDAGSGAYVRALQPSGGAGFTVLVNGNSGPIAPAIMPLIDVIRIK